MKVKLIIITPDAEKNIEKIGRVCYDSERFMNELSAPKFIKNLIARGHTSVLEHAQATFYIDEVSRALTHQLVRHRIASYCLTGDTVVYSDRSNRSTKKRTISELYNMKKCTLDKVRIRVVDENSHLLTTNKIMNIYKTGAKEVFKVVTTDGYSIKTTKEHRFLTKEGWKTLENIKVGEKLYTNGLESEFHKNRDWLSFQYTEKNLSQEEIADMCGVSKHTIRQYVRLFNLQKPLGSWTIGVKPANYNKTKENYEPLQRSSNNLLGNRNGAKKEGIYKSTYRQNPMDLSLSGAYKRTHEIIKKSGTCSRCLKSCSTEIHHKDHNPNNVVLTNLIELCVKCHKTEHKKEVVRYIRLSEVFSIESVGNEDTYDIEMYTPHHNFVANGFIVHNCQRSQRYCKEGGFGFYTPASIQNDPEKLEKYVLAMKFLQTTYDALIEADCKPEDARMILPNACHTQISVTMNFRALRNFFELRCDEHAQEEIRTMARKMLIIMHDEAPSCFEDLYFKFFKGAEAYSKD